MILINQLQRLIKDLRFMKYRNIFHFFYLFKKKKTLRLLNNFFSAINFEEKPPNLNLSKD